MIVSGTSKERNAQTKSPNKTKRWYADITKLLGTRAWAYARTSRQNVLQHGTIHKEKQCQEEESNLHVMRLTKCFCARKFVSILRLDSRANSDAEWMRFCRCCLKPWERRKHKEGKTQRKMAREGSETERWGVIWYRKRGCKRGGEHADGESMARERDGKRSRHRREKERENGSAQDKTRKRSGYAKQMSKNQQKTQHNMLWVKTCVENYKSKNSVSAWSKTVSSFHSVWEAPNWYMQWLNFNCPYMNEQTRKNDRDTCEITHVLPQATKVVVPQLFGPSLCAVWLYVPCRSSVRPSGPSSPTRLYPH